MSNRLHVIDHPLLATRLTVLRDKSTGTAEFRRIVREIGAFLAYEATRDMQTAARSVETPLQAAPGAALADPPPCIAPVLRAGIGFAEGMLDAIPEAAVAHIGLYRDHQTLKPVEYYLNAPPRLEDRLVLVADPMLATGNSGAAAIDRLKAAGARQLRFVALLAAPEGAARLENAHPDVDIFTAAMDERLNEKGYILPGLGDAGDRQYGTV